MPSNEDQNKGDEHEVRCSETDATCPACKQRIQTWDEFLESVPAVVAELTKSRDEFIVANHDTEMADPKYKQHEGVWWSALLGLLHTTDRMNLVDLIECFKHAGATVVRAGLLDTMMERLNGDDKVTKH